MFTILSMHIQDIGKVRKQLLHRLSLWLLDAAWCYVWYHCIDCIFV